MFRLKKTILKEMELCQTISDLERELEYQVKEAHLDCRVEMALMVYQVLVDMRDHGLDNTNHWDTLLERVLTVLEEEMGKKC